MELIKAQKQARIARPPTHLSEEMRRWWKRVIHEYELSDHHLHLLRAACESWDRSQAARAAVTAEGLTLVDARGVTRAHPCIAVEQQNRKLFISALRELGLDVRMPEPARAPVLPSYRGAGEN